MEPDIAMVAALIGEPARAKMLTALMGGKALTATELAMTADITPQTATSHLSRLVEGKLLVVRKQGRHKYFQLTGCQVAELIEQLLNLSVQLALPGVKFGPSDDRLRHSRVCYDHLAGDIAVKLFDALVRIGALSEMHPSVQLTAKGRTFFSELKADINALERSKRPLCKACLDWSERRSHLAGSLGKWILDDAVQRQWVVQDLDSRAIAFTARGLKAFCKRYQIRL